MIQFSGIFGLAGFFFEWQDSADINPVFSRVKIEIYPLNTARYDCVDTWFFVMLSSVKQLKPITKKASPHVHSTQYPPPPPAGI